MNLTWFVVVNYFADMRYMVVEPIHEINDF